MRPKNHNHPAAGGATLYHGNTPVRHSERAAEGSFVSLLGEPFYRISHVNHMPPFLMSLVSSSDHWLFVSSNGGLTAGRSQADHALFPYETEDKISRHAEHNGCKTILRVQGNGSTSLWEPFSERYAGIYRRDRHLYKNVYGNKLLFEEVNHDLGLTFRYAWRTGNRFGFIRSCWLENHGAAALDIEMLDGLQNVLPAGITVQLQSNLSSLLNAYKRSQLEEKTGLGLFALSATLSDGTEPSEALRSTVVWQTGLEPTAHLLSDRQIDAFRHGGMPRPEHDLRGGAGAYLVHTHVQLPAGAQRHWHIIADVHKDSAAVVRLQQTISQDHETLEAALEADIARGTTALRRYVAAADGLQHTAEQIIAPHHFANVLFNIMRGGIFAKGHEVDTADLRRFVRTRNRPVLRAHATWFAALPPRLSVNDLYASAAATKSADLIRLAYEYLPLTFSRRHGDPSRPWNQFAINLTDDDGTALLDYQGNWRDIFQNWEPLVLAFPRYLPGIIAKFLNATTADGYNPYRVTRDGIEWEVPEPENPWSNIGYWSDHQIIYLQKLLEIAAQIEPGSLQALLHKPVFTYANVPYRLRPYTAMLEDWSNTIVFDWDKETAVEALVAREGSDGRLLRDADGQVVHVTMLEKLLVLLLAKVTNLVPDGGIWMNTQRPEWNDANNALVGKGLSVVTTAYMLRFVDFWRQHLATVDTASIPVNAAVRDLLLDVNATLAAFENRLIAGFDDHSRRSFMDALGDAASRYRELIYSSGLPAEQTDVSPATVARLLDLTHDYLVQTLRANRRADGLYHTYNVLRLDEASAAVDNLYLMLEGQVAVLSAGLLTAAEALRLLRGLRQSALYRADQHSYLLYPDRELPGFLEKNNVAAEHVSSLALVAALAANQDPRLLIADQSGTWHFNADFHNAGDVARMLDILEEEPEYSALVAEERRKILSLFEATFNHAAFTGRSGTFFAYEGLGSIYWHMVAKLLLAAYEVYEAAQKAGAPETAELARAYFDIRAGLGFNKTPLEFGAFPTDPYSHTPTGSGARQPGMTGLVKEEILTRWGELGVQLRQGTLHFVPTLLQPEELLSSPGTFGYVDLEGQPQEIPLPAAALAFTVCQTPVVYVAGDKATITVDWTNGQTDRHEGSTLPAEVAQHLFDRDGEIHLLTVSITLDPT